VASKGLVVVEPKTARSRRTIHLAAGAVSAIARHERLQAKWRLHAGPLWQENSLVFATQIGGPLDGGQVKHKFHSALAAAGLPDIRVHDLRHTSATLLLTRGVHPKVVQEMLGYSTITLTLDTYGHLVPSLQAQLVNHMDRLFGFTA
jgi:integrase